VVTRTVRPNCHVPRSLGAAPRCRELAEERRSRIIGLVTSYYGASGNTEATLEVRALLEGLLPGEGDLLEALHRVQHRYGYIPPASIPGVSQHLRLPPSRVYGAVTYYSEFRQEPPADTTISWCSGPACYIKGGAGVREILEKLVGCALGEKTADGRLGLHMGQCNGTCDHAPQVWVDGKVVGDLTPSKTVELVNELKSRPSTGPAPHA
jgi:NADH:ubiquinone oxidoreductase subunit E